MGVGRIALLFGVGVFAVAVAFSGLDRLTARQPEAARLVMAPFRAQADRSAAANYLARQQAPAALRHSERAVAEDPVDQDSAALLGSARFLAGDADGAAAAFRVAARFGWRNVATQIYWYDAALQAGDFEVAADRADAILRTHPFVMSDRDALLAPLESNPQARPVLLDHLAARPNWLGRYLGLDAASSQDLVRRRAETIEQLGESGRPLGCRQVFRVTQTLMAQGNRPLALRVWNANCRRAAVNSPIADASFQQIDSEDASPFGWQVFRSGDVSITVAGDGAGGRSVLMQNRASNMRLALQQPVGLARGSYRLSARVRDENGQPADRLVASIGCGAPPFPAGALATLSGAGQTIAAPACDNQFLGIWIKPGGTNVTIDSLQLRPIG